MRTVFHFTPAKGWFNDPNGLIEHRGVHHLFFQHNPVELKMRDMCWGHATSTDLVTWVEHPIALPPVPGITDMRDHSARWDGRSWRQVLAGGASGEGMLFGYSSPDLVDWSWDGVVLRATDAGLPGRVWECPDVFEVDGEVVAIISLIDDDRSPVLWLTGTLDGARIIPRRWGLVDHGDRLYAPQSYTDRTGRRLMIGWLRTHLDPAAAGMASLGVASLPRVLTVVDGSLHQEPAAELRRLRAAPRSRRPEPAEREASIALGGAAALEVRIGCRSAEALLGLGVDLDDAAGHRMTVTLACFAEAGRLPAGGDPRADAGAARTATIIVDSGIVETILDDGRAAAVTDAALGAVGRVRVRWTADAPEEVTVWVLEAPDGPSGDVPAGEDRAQVRLDA